MSDTGYDANDLAVLIRDNSGLSGSEIRERVQGLQHDYEGPVNQEAACFLLAREVGVDLSKHLDLRQEPELQVENLVEDMKDVQLQVKVDTVFPVNSFDGGKVRNIRVYDDTDTTYLTVWDEDVEAFEGVTGGDVLRIDGGYTTYNDKMSRLEVHIGSDGKVIDVDSAEELIG